MLPELGHFALVLALMLAGLQALLRHRRSGAGSRALGRRHHLGRRRAVRHGRHGGRHPGLRLRQLRFLGAVRRRELQFGAAADVSHRGAVGRARRLAAAVDLPAGGVDAGRRDRLAQSAAALRGARAGRARRPEFRLPAVHARHLGPVPAPDPGGGRWPRSQSAAAGSGVGGASAGALHRLRGSGGGILVRLCGDARGPHGPGLGALDAPLDHGGVGLPDLRHRPRQLVVLLHAGLGRLLGVGSGRERLLHALAGRHGTDPFAGGHRETRPVQELDAAAGHSRLFIEPAGDLPGALRRAGLGAFLRCRSDARALHPGLPRHRDRRRPDAVRMACSAAEVQRRLRSAVARKLPAVQQHPAGGGRGNGARRHAGAADR